MIVTSIERISTDSSGNQANNSNSNPTFSPDGTKVLFTSSASNLVPGDTNGTSDLFVKDLVTGAVTFVNSDDFGNVANSGSYNPIFSPDGTKVLFTSSASNLVPGDTNGTSDLFVKDLASGVVTRVNTDDFGNEANSGGSDAIFSPDGTKVLFTSSASNLVPGDTNSVNDIFIKDLVSEVVTRVSTDSNGNQANSTSVYPIFSPDGTKVAFLSNASNLVPGDTNGQSDTFVKDLISGTVTRVSTDNAGNQASGQSFYAPVFSPDGTKVAFFNNASNLVPDDSGKVDLFIKDLTDGAVVRININHQEAGWYPYNMGHLPIFSSNGTEIIIGNSSSNIVSGDTNGQADIFIISLVAPQNLMGDDDDNILIGGDGSDLMLGGAGNDTLIGNGGKDTLYGENGDDILLGGDGSDKISGDDGDDYLSGGTGNDLLSGGIGADSLIGDDGDDYLSGGAGNDVLSGGLGNDVLVGDEGSDYLIGESGGDILSGGAGLDVLYGGGGADWFVFQNVNALDTVDRIMDFSTAQGDVLHLADLLYDFDPLSDAITDFVKSTEVSGSSTIAVDLDGSGNTYGFQDFTMLMGVTGLNVDNLYDTGKIVVA